MSTSNDTPPNSASDPEVRYLAGRRVVFEALERNAPVTRIFLQQKVNAPVLRQLRHDANRLGIPVQWIPKSQLDKKASGAVHQGVVAELAALPYRILEEMLNDVASDTEVVRSRRPMILVLDGIEDPQNYGAILRTAVAAAVDGVVVGAKRQAPLSSAAIKTSSGAAFRIPIARTEDLSAALVQLKERGYWVVGEEGSSPTPMWAFDWNRPLAIVLGNEGKGLSPEVSKTCDFLVSIPITGDMDSLNVSVAAGVLLYEAARCRSEPRPFDGRLLVGSEAARISPIRQ